MKFKVTERAQRPADMNGRCFYCNVEIGGYHRPNCVLISKLVKVRMTVEMTMDVPSDWDKELIEFSRNEGRWCANNAIYQLEQEMTTGDCLCGNASFEYICDESGPYLSEDGSKGSKI